MRIGCVSLNISKDSFLSVVKILSVTQILLADALVCQCEKVLERFSVTDD